MKNLTLETFKDKNDLSQMVFVREKSREIDKIDSLSTLESTPTAKELSDSLCDKNCIPTRDILLVKINNEIIGYSKLGWWTENDGTWLYLHNSYLIPKWREKGIYKRMLLWSEDRIKEIANNHENKGKSQFGSNATSTEKEKTKILLANGYKKVFTMIEMDFDISQSLQDISLPTGFEIREVNLENLRKIWDVNISIYKNRDFVTSTTEVDFKKFLKNPNIDFSLWHVAWKGNDIASFVISEVNGRRGEVIEVSTVEKYRRKGLAQSLLTKNILALKSKNINVIRLHTNGENLAGARSLYEKIGFTHLKDHVRYRKTLT
jgi:mycothiol synthase